MLWKIGDYIFCEKSQSLDHRGGKQQLEPLIVAALAFFCRNPETIISRDQLVEEVWQSAAITDNAVSRVIAKLRKLFGDQPKEPRYIATYPKKGYMFIAPVTRLEEAPPVTKTALAGGGPPSLEAVVPETGTVSLKAGAEGPSWVRRFVLVCAFVILLLVAWWAVPRKPEILPQKVKPVRVQVLTREGDRAQFPVASPDGRYLAFSILSAEGMRLFLKDLELQQQVEIGEAQGWSGPPAWSHDGRYLVFLHSDSQQSRYLVLSLSGLKVTDRQVVYTCAKDSYGKAIFGPDDQSLIFAEAKGAGAPYEMYSLDLRTKKTVRLPQPPLVLGGNSQFDLHPNQDSLLISSPNEAHWLALYHLDLVTEQLDYLFEIREYTCCAVWDHQGEGVVIMGEHPAQKIVRYSLDGSNREVLLEVPQRVAVPVRFPNGRDYLYVGLMHNRDIFVWDSETQSQQKLIKTSVDDRLPALTPDGRLLAYISERTGHEEIWLYHLEDRAETSLTSGTDGRHYFDLQWSPDGRHLAALTLNELFLIDVPTGAVRGLVLPQGEYRGLSWRDADHLCFGLGDEQGWRVFGYNTQRGELNPHPGDWTSVAFAENEADSLWVDGEGTFFYGDFQQPLGFTPEEVYQRGRFSVIKRGNAIYYLRHRGSGMELVRYDLQQKGLAVILSLDASDGFALGSGKIYFAETVYAGADIYRTLFPEER